ncbi:MAG: GNAT family N-acetyltransferase, partial [Bdellovibrionales bacterium]|nr:GNAT family N-acetyltransferase [Bdellovibrionales bacterium]
AIPHPYKMSDADFWVEEVKKLKIKNNGVLSIFAIRNASDGEAIGAIGYHNYKPDSPHSAELGYWLAKPFWNKGIMTEVVKGFSKYGFETLGMGRITANVFYNNKGSARVLEKAGFCYEGLKRSHYKKNDKIFDGKSYSLLPSDLTTNANLDRPDFIKHYLEIQKPDNAKYPGSDELLTIGSPFAKKLGLTKLGIHHEELLPGRRTSWPHAESLEDEFVFVIEGRPHAWIDGNLHRLNPGDGVAFPSGTGIAHTIINNTESVVRLLVVGEANNDLNKCIYPLQPERNEEIRAQNFLWEDAPKRELGNHDGLPDQLRKSSPNGPRGAE